MNPKKFLDYCEEKEGFIIRQMEADLQSFKKALFALRQRRREKFMVGWKENNGQFFTMDNNQYKGMSLEEKLDDFHYTAAPHFKTYLDMGKNNPFKN